MNSCPQQDLSDSELRARLVQRGVASAEADELVAGRVRRDEHSRIDQILEGRAP